MSYVKRKDVSCTVAYLIGVEDRFLASTYEGYDDLLQGLRGNDNANVIRYLCRLRTALLKNFRLTDEKLRYDVGNLPSIEWFDKDEISKLEKLGISVVQANYRATDYSLLFSKLIDDNIDSCKKLIPEYVDWSYIRGLFVIPNYNSKSAMIEEFNKFMEYRSFYPFSVYIHWNPTDRKGLLLDDKLFLQSLYAMHDKEFVDRNKYIDVSEITSANIYDFIDKGNKVVIAVDCENADVYKLYGFLRSLSQEELLKIDKMVLYDDKNTVDTWKLLSDYVNVPVKYVEVERVLGRKSLVDMSLAMGISEDFYVDGIDSFIIVSSDSDYFSVVSKLKNARFMIVYEDIKSSEAALKLFEAENAFCCSADAFFTGDTVKLKEGILLQKANDALSTVKLNCKDILDTVYKAARIVCSEDEKQSFYDKYLKNLSISVDKDGDIHIKAGK